MDTSLSVLYFLCRVLCELCNQLGHTLECKFVPSLESTYNIMILMSSLYNAVTSEYNDWLYTFAFVSNPPHLCDTDYVVATCSKELQETYSKSLCEHTWTCVCVTLSMVPRADKLTQRVTVTSLSLCSHSQSDNAMLIVRKHSLAVVLCHTHYCVFFVPFSQSPLRKEHLLSIAQLNQGISDLKCVSWHQNTFSLLWVTGAILRSIPRRKEGF